MARTSDDRTDAQASFGEAIVAAGKVDRVSLRNAEALCAGKRERLPGMLAKLGLAAERDIAEALSQGLRLPLLEARAMPRDPPRIPGLSPRFLHEMRIVPIDTDDEAITVAMADPTDAYALEALRMASGRSVRVTVAEAGLVQRTIEEMYAEELHREPSPGSGGTNGADGDIERLRDQASEAPVIRLVNGLIASAVERRASDIHIEPFERALKVRFRIDGLLTDAEAPGPGLAAAMVSRIKIMAGLDIAERRRPQDGRIRVTASGRPVDLRVSIVPAMHGECVVLRILDRAGVRLDFEALGLSAGHRAGIEVALSRPEGIFLVTGPTGSGKTTTLYAGLTWLNRPDRKILTVEDPIEYELEGVNQVQVRSSIGLDFAAVLRSLLRHDPDVIMVGEIRDAETARIAVQAALTGHTVISTLHTNDAVSAVTRLIDMGVEPFLLSSTLNGVAAQRLVRRLCPACRRPEPVPEDLVRSLGLDPEGSTALQHFRPVGCDACGGRGYSGRTVLFELVRITEPLRELILGSPGTDALRRLALREGLTAMFDDGVAKALAGVTTFEEVLRTTRGG